MPRARVILEPDADVPASLERHPGDAALEDVAAEHGNRPRNVAAVEQLEVRVERGARRLEPEAREEALVAPEVELHHRSRRQASGPPPGEHAPQEPGLVDRDARTEPEPVAQAELVGDVVERVRVHDPRHREPVRSQAAEVHRPRVTE